MGSWTISGDLAVIAVEPITSRQTKADIPDWILDDTARVSDQIVLNATCWNSLWLAESARLAAGLPSGSSGPFVIVNA